MFTIIIFTLERHFLLKRSIDYYKNFDCNILIADSSEKKMNYVFPDNVVYRHLPGMHCSQKILFMAETITTPYVCLSADDDYLLESSLRTGANFLNDNLDFVSVQGKYLKFEVVDEKIVFSPKYGPEASSYSVTNDDIYSRMVRAFNPYMHQVLSLQRKDVFISSIRATSSLDDSHHITMVEFMLSIIPMCHGKHKVLPLLWMARDAAEFERPVAYAEAKPEKSKYLFLHYYKSFQHQIREFQIFLESENSQILKKQIGTEVSQLISDSKEIDNIFNAALNSLIKSYRYYRNNVLLKIFIKLFIPDWVLNYLKKRKPIKHMNGIDENYSSNIALNKIRLSVLTFPDVYNNLRKK
jgi:glycosyltransferase domain-containing protein